MVKIFFLSSFLLGCVSQANEAVRNNSSINNRVYLNFKQLRFISSNLKEIGSSEELESVEELHLQQNYLSRLPPNIKKLKNLKILYLDWNRMRSLPRAFGNLEKLEVLSISKNKLGNLPKSFKDLNHLETLDISENEIKILPNDIGDLASLKFLNIGSNKIENLPFNFGNSKSLETLLAMNNSIKVLPESFKKLKNLIILRLDNNLLEEIPESFNQLDKLNTLTLNHNNLSKNIESFNVLLNLEKLYRLSIANNKLSSLSEGFKDIKVKELDLSGNEFSTFNLDEISSGLKTLNLSKNFQLKTLQILSNELNNLETLWLNQTILGQEENSLNVVMGLRNLKRLDLSSSSINKFNTDFSLLQNLEELDLSSNYLTEIPPGLNLEKIRILILDTNKINILDIEDFLSKLKSIEYLNLSRNKLKDEQKNRIKEYFDGKKTKNDTFIHVVL